MPFKNFGMSPRPAKKLHPNLVCHCRPGSAISVAAPPSEPAAHAVRLSMHLLCCALAVHSSYQRHHALPGATRLALVTIRALRSTLRADVDREVSPLER